MTQNDYIVMKKSSREKLIKELKEVKKENQQLKEIITEARKYIEKHPCNTWYSVEKPNKDLREVKIIKHQEELLNILKR